MEHRRRPPAARRCDEGQGYAWSVELTFFGTRGSCPCAGGQYRVYGGNTACVGITIDGGEQIILDLGTGLRALGTTLDGPDAHPPPLRASALLSHLHLDHVVGLPFFAPLRNQDTVLDIYGPKQPAGDLYDALSSLVQPPFFPIPLALLPGQIRCHDTGDEDLVIGAAKVRARAVAHRGPTLGFRIEANGASVAYIPDHQQPADGTDLDDSVLELCADVDVLIHDGQYTEAEQAAKPHWGHSSVAFAVRIAREVGARELVLFHHDPSHDDAAVERLLGRARELAGDRVSVSAAREGERLTPGRR
jgi:phosphoribosyl 1,2-cyclic phosphodiesterase